MVWHSFRRNDPPCAATHPHHGSGSCLWVFPWGQWVNCLRNFWEEKWCSQQQQQQQKLKKKQQLKVGRLSWVKFSIGLFDSILLYKWICNFNGDFMDIRYGKKQTFPVNWGNKLHISMIFEDEKSLSTGWSCLSMIINGFQSFGAWPYIVPKSLYYSVSVYVSLVDRCSTWNEKLFLRHLCKGFYLCTHK